MLINFFTLFAVFFTMVKHDDYKESHNVLAFSYLDARKDSSKNN